MKRVIQGLRTLHFVGCPSERCAITSNPLKKALYGAFPNGSGCPKR